MGQTPQKHQKQSDEQLNSNQEYAIVGYLSLILPSFSPIAAGELRAPRSRTQPLSPSSTSPRSPPHRPSDTTGQVNRHRYDIRTHKIHAWGCDLAKHTLLYCNYKKTYQSGSKYKPHIRAPPARPPPRLPHKHPPHYKATNAL